MMIGGTSTKNPVVDHAVVRKAQGKPLTTETPAPPLCLPVLVNRTGES